MAKLIDGSKLAETLREQAAEQASAFFAAHGVQPGLGVVLVGDNPASASYVRMKRRACERAGLHSTAHYLPASASQAEVEAVVNSLNDDPRIHGILVQLPLPPHIDEARVMSLVRLEKDVDGFHPVNIGALAQKGREPLFTPATPTGVMALLDHAGVSLSGANAVVVGRSNIVGMPVALMLLHRDATVTVCHSRTRGLETFLAGADVLIAAAGRPNFIRGEWLKPGAVVIDVGTNQVPDPADPRGYRYVGDVDYDSAVGVVSAITPVPGGVGPMTIAMLLANTIKAAVRTAGPR